MKPTCDGTVEIRNRNVAKDTSGKLVVMGRNVAIIIMDAKGNERATHKLGYGSRLLVDEGDTVKRGQRIAEWDPYTRPILTEVDGTVAFEDVVDGVSVNEVIDEATGITNRVDHRLALQPARLDTEARHRHQGREGRSEEAGTWRRSPLPAVG